MNIKEMNELLINKYQIALDVFREWDESDYPHIEIDDFVVWLEEQKDKP